MWLWLHYNSQRGSRAGEFETRRLAALAENAQQMEARIKTLESILDAENPGWRQS
ncbi:envelope stress response membrane protein PspB [Klebsiella pneumoniae]|nr:envelope stress response membrane protein PspB [Klebsiella pneumoniae]